MIVMKKPRILHYWTTNIFLETLFEKEIMSRTHFLLILSSFHMANNALAIRNSHPGHDAFHNHKVDYLYDHLGRLFKELSIPTRKVCFDGAMYLGCGHLKFIVYMKDQPKPWGIKLYELCEFESGYVFDFEIYCADSKPSNRALDVCIRLLEPLLDCGYWCYPNNYYSCPELSEKLLEKGPMTVGTVRSNRKGKPQDLKTVKMKTGESVYRRKGNIAVVKWKDKREVSVITTVHDPTKTVDLQTRTQIKRKPDAVNNYSQHVIGGDMNDQLLAYTPLRRHSLKWFTKLFLLRVHSYNHSNLHSTQEITPSEKKKNHETT